ncbi:MAG: hypothetical protein NTU66_04650 [Elusimicrobia bacterium]|nr:hypothetical protein [Elusimicrobiota bacterium]
MIRRTGSLLVCIIGVLLPWRLRIIYAEIIAWTVQAVYSFYFWLFNLILKNVEKRDVAP